RGAIVAPGDVGASRQLPAGIDARGGDHCLALAVLHARELPARDLLDPAAVPFDAGGSDPVPSIDGLGAAAALADDPRRVQATTRTTNSRAADRGVCAPARRSEHATGGGTPANRATARGSRRGLRVRGPPAASGPYRRAL